MIAGMRLDRDDVVVLDEDGAVFVRRQDVDRVWSLARRIQEREAEQARRARDGEGLCEQFEFSSFLERRRQEPGLTFRAHLRRIGKSIEE